MRHNLNTQALPDFLNLNDDKTVLHCMYELRLTMNCYDLFLIWLLKILEIYD